MKISRIPFHLRGAMALANIVARAIGREQRDTHLRAGSCGLNGCPICDHPEQEEEPVLLSIRGGAENPTFHYEGGIVVTVHQEDGHGPSAAGSKCEGWAVTRLAVRYYPAHTPPNPLVDYEGYKKWWEEYYRNPPAKIEEVWGLRRLRELRRRSWWGYNPCLPQEGSQGEFSLWSGPYFSSIDRGEPRVLVMEGIVPTDAGPSWAHHGSFEYDLDDPEGRERACRLAQQWENRLKESLRKEGKLISFRIPSGG